MQLIDSEKYFGYVKLARSVNFLFISMQVPKVVLQPLGLRCVHCAIHDKRDVHEE